ncbi:MAG: hypothetical protein JXA13_06265 [Anaerolineales bacterium]|nr:hypothetical protein [Anaerolineales bacterium]
MPKWSFFLIAFIVGLTAGLVYGWVINPVEFIDTTPETLREDYRTDYILMVAEAYQGEQDIQQAAQRLAIFGSQAPSRIVTTAYQQAQQYQYTEADLQLIQELASDLENWTAAPAGETIP